MRDKWYILDGKKAVPVGNVMDWAEWFEKAKSERHVAVTEIGDCRISTVFLGLDHNWFDGPPLLFESMIFGGAHDGEMDRYGAWEEAEAGHARMVEKAKAALAQIG